MKRARRVLLLEAYDPATDEPLSLPETSVPYTSEKRMRQAAERIVSEYRAEVEVIYGLWEVPGVGITGVPCPVAFQK